METISQATNALKTTIWGGDNNTTANSHGTHSEIHKSMIDDTVTESKFNGRLESDPNAEDSYQPPEQHDTDRRPQGPVSTGGQPQGANVTGDVRDTNKNPFSSSNEPNTGFGGSAGAQPSVGADPTSGQRDTSRHQGGDKPYAEPDIVSTGSGSSGISGVGSTDSGISGLGGGAGGPGGPGGMKLPDSENPSKEEGTGTKYEKSTGLACEGGDFDATRPGAAREAARLMDEKGIAHGDTPGDSGQPKKEKKWYGVDHSGFGGHGSHKNKRPSVSKSSDGLSGDEAEAEVTTTRATDDYPDTGKKGLGQKIKEKLHHSSAE